MSVDEVFKAIHSYDYEKAKILFTKNIRSIFKELVNQNGIADDSPVLLQFSSMTGAIFYFLSLSPTKRPSLTEVENIRLLETCLNDIEFPNKLSENILALSDYDAKGRLDIVSSESDTLKWKIVSSFLDLLKPLNTFLKTPLTNRSSVVTLERLSHMASYEKQYKRFLRVMSLNVFQPLKILDDITDYLELRKDIVDDLCASHIDRKLEQLISMAKILGRISADPLQFVKSVENLISATNSLNFQHFESKILSSGDIVIGDGECDKKKVVFANSVIEILNRNGIDPILDTEDMRQETESRMYRYFLTRLKDIAGDLTEEELKQLLPDCERSKQSLVRISHMLNATDSSDILLTLGSLLEVNEIVLRLLGPGDVENKLTQLIKYRKSDFVKKTSVGVDKNTSTTGTLDPSLKFKPVLRLVEYYEITIDDIAKFIEALLETKLPSVNSVAFLETVIKKNTEYGGLRREVETLRSSEKSLQEDLDQVQEELGELRKQVYVLKKYEMVSKDRKQQYEDLFGKYEDLSISYDELEKAYNEVAKEKQTYIDAIKYGTIVSEEKNKEIETLHAEVERLKSQLSG